MNIFTRVAALAFGLCIASCNNGAPTTTAQHDSVLLKATAKPQDTAIYDEVSCPKWLPPLADSYINNTDNEAIKFAIEKWGDTVEEWSIDHMQLTDTGKYFILGIGHDVSDDEGTRFITDEWLYVDTVKKLIYEYDLPNDQIIQWVNKQGR